MDPASLLAAIPIIIVALVVILFIRATCFFTVQTQDNAIVERFGKFVRVAKPGLNLKVPFIDRVTKPISLRIQQLEVNIESKTKDNVFVTVPVAVQYVIPEANVADAYYRLSDPTAQIRSYVFDVVRSALSGLDLDQAFESKDDIALSVEKTLSNRMREYGFEIVNTLVTDISPDPRVRDSMNSINAAQRDRVAAQSLAEADKIKRVTQAEAEAEAKRLQGVGVAAQRKAIAEGIAEQFEMLKKVGIENTAEQLLLMTQYFDTMQDVARNSRTNVLYLPSNPGAVGGMFDEIRNSLLQSRGAELAFEESREQYHDPNLDAVPDSVPAPKPAPRPVEHRPAQVTSHSAQRALPDPRQYLSPEQQQAVERARQIAQRFTGNNG